MDKRIFRKDTSVFTVVCFCKVAFQSRSIPNAFSWPLVINTIVLIFYHRQSQWPICSPLKKICLIHVYIEIGLTLHVQYKRRFIRIYFAHCVASTVGQIVAGESRNIALSPPKNSWLNPPAKGYPNIYSQFDDMSCKKFNFTSRPTANGWNNCPPTCWQAKHRPDPFSLSRHICVCFCCRETPNWNPKSKQALSDPQLISRSADAANFHILAIFDCCSTLWILQLSIHLAKPPLSQRKRS